MKKNPFSFKLDSAILSILLIWMMISALYYAENLFSPGNYINHEEGATHKTIKYVVCIFFTILLSILARAYSMLVAIGILVLICLLLIIYSGVIDLSTLSILIAASMVSFMHVPAIWPTKLITIGRAIVYAGAIVGVFSLIELTVLATLFESNWASTGSIRSVSTMLNPNNLGRYAGACLILLPYLQLRTLPQAICGTFIVFSFVTSGSRTSWLALFAVLIFQLLTSRSFRNTIRKLIRGKLFKLIAICGLTLIIFTTYKTLGTQPEIEVVHRGADLYTASLRWDNVVRFVNALDMSILFPDLANNRTDFIQDSFYLVILNSFGVVGILVLLPFFLTHFKIRRSNNADFTPWKMVFAYYMISGLGGSHLNSFPNNQLFFLSLGAVYVFNTRTTQSKNTVHQEHSQTLNIRLRTKG